MTQLQFAPANESAYNTEMNLPILLTWMRIGAIPLVVILYFLPLPHAHFIAALIFGLAAITDFLDGYLARTLQVESGFGAFLDPVADKLIVSITLIALMVNLDNWLFILGTMVIIGREIVVSAMREWLGQIGKHTKLAVSYIAKIKTTLQLGGIAFLVWYTPGETSWQLWVGMTLFMIAAGLTLWTMVQYLKTAWSDLTFSQDQE